MLVTWGKRALLTAAVTVVLTFVGLATTGTGPSAGADDGTSAASAASARVDQAVPRADLASQTDLRSPLVTGTISAPGGPFLRDRFGRAVILHGVNIVYKHPPFAVYPDPGKPWNFDLADARRIAALGFNMVRLGILWQGLEPGRLGPNSPAVCDPGRPVNPHQLNPAIIRTYLDHVARTVDLLASVHIYTLLDMHQDVYNQAFGGEGAPAWAVCTQGAHPYPTPSDWRMAYREPAVAAAYRSFFDNSVRGNLQGQFASVWSAVAERFSGDPWVLGYDLFNEPAVGDGALACFYAGRGAGNLMTAGGEHVSCPPTEPASGLIPRVLAAAPHQLIFVEPDVSAHPVASELGSLPFPNLVLNFHLYCPFRNLDGNPPPMALAACGIHDRNVLLTRSIERMRSASAAQPGGPAWFMSEFGATSSLSDITQVTADANRFLLGWCYWSWEYYADPTGSASEALATPAGIPIAAKAWTLSQTYAQAVAGTPVTMSFAPSSGNFDLAYVPDQAIHAPTVVFVPTALHYRAGYCASVSGASITSAPGSDHLTLANLPGASEVHLSLAAGGCRGGTGHLHTGASLALDHHHETRATTQHTVYSGSQSRERVAANRAHTRRQVRL